MRLLIFLFFAGAAVAQAPSSYKPFGTLADLMAGILLPNSETIFNVTRQAPKTDKEWTNVQTSAVVLAEVGNLLLLPGRKKETGGLVPVHSAEWRKHVRALVESAQGAYKAAQTKNADAVFNACEPLYQACFTCHETYRFCPTCPEAPPRKP
jgi:hypothetical protein